jgi:hypothetical protein
MSQGKLSGNPSARYRVRQCIPVRGTWPWLGKWIDRVAESWARFARLRPAGAHGHGSTRFASSARDMHRRAAFRRGIAWGGGLVRSATTTTSSPRRPTGSWCACAFTVNLVLCGSERGVWTSDVQASRGPGSSPSTPLRSLVRFFYHLACRLGCT